LNNEIIKNEDDENYHLILLLNLFDGHISLTEILEMDKPRLDGLIRARNKYIDESLKERKRQEELALLGKNKDTY
jgi:hypothetical protein